MSFSLYLPADRFLHRADPLAKMLAILLCFVASLAGRRLPVLAAMAGLVLVLAAWAGLLRLLRRFAGFFALLFVTSTLLWGILTREESTFAGGLARGAPLGLRLVVMMALGLALLGTTRIEELASALTRLGLPFTAAFSLTLAFRLLPLLAGTGATIVQAQACRGVDLREGGPIRRLRLHLPLLVPLVLSALRTADALSMALESRGMGMRPGRTSAARSRMKGSDIIMLVLCAAGAVAAWVAR